MDADAGMSSNMKIGIAVVVVIIIAVVAYLLLSGGGGSGQGPIQNAIKAAEDAAKGVWGGVKHVFDSTMGITSTVASGAMGLASGAAGDVANVGEAAAGAAEQGVSTVYHTASNVVSDIDSLF
jgi:hypothetical protein